jgi:hypothetical protein
MLAFGSTSITCFNTISEDTTAYNFIVHMRWLMLEILLSSGNVSLKHSAVTPHKNYTASGLLLHSRSRQALLDHYESTC